MLHSLEKVIVFDISTITASVVSDGIVIYFGSRKPFSSFICSGMNATFVKENGLLEEIAVPYVGVPK